MKGSEEQPKILIVDDEAANLHLYAKVLREDYTVQTAEDGEKALSHLDETIDVVWLDRRMAGLSGDHVLEEIRDRGYGCPVVIISALDPGLDILALDFDEYLVKPLDLEAIRTVADAMLDRASHDASTREYLARTTKKVLLESNVRKESLAQSPQFAKLKVEIEALADEVDVAEVNDDR